MGATAAQVREGDEVREVSCAEADEHMAEVVDQVVPPPPADTTQTSRTRNCLANSDPRPRRGTNSAQAQVKVRYRSKLAGPAVVAF